MDGVSGITWHRLAVELGLMLLARQGTFTSVNAKKGSSQRGAPKEMVIARTVDVNAQAVRTESPQQSLRCLDALATADVTCCSAGLQRSTRGQPRNEK